MDKRTEKKGLLGPGILEGFSQRTNEDYLETKTSDGFPAEWAIGIVFFIFLKFKFAFSLSIILIVNCHYISSR